MTKKPAKEAAAAPSASASENLIQMVSSNLRLFRAAKRMTQRDLAEASGISQKHISGIELSGSNLTLDLIARLCLGLGITPAELLTPIHIPGSPR
jgi:transcriptional regulator with XRE-family HTH domain